MALSTRIRISIVSFASLFYFKKRSKVIFYHDIHSDKKYTEMSTPIEVFKNHIQIILENGYEIVAEITKPIGQIEICFDFPLPAVVLASMATFFISITFSLKTIASIFYYWSIGIWQFHKLMMFVFSYEPQWYLVSLIDYPVCF